jgi:hypothetical protein
VPGPAPQAPREPQPRDGVARFLGASARLRLLLGACRGGFALALLERALRLRFAIELVARGPFAAQLSRRRGALDSASRIRWVADLRQRQRAAAAGGKAAGAGAMRGGGRGSRLGSRRRSGSHRRLDDDGRRPGSGSGRDRGRGGEHRCRPAGCRSTGAPCGAQGPPRGSATDDDEEGHGREHDRRAVRRRLGGNSGRARAVEVRLRMRAGSIDRLVDAQRVVVRVGLRPVVGRVG